MSVKRRDLIQYFEDNGFRLLREGANHSIYTNGPKTIPVKRHRQLDRITANELCKQAGVTPKFWSPGATPRRLVSGAPDGAVLIGDGQFPLVPGVRKILGDAGVGGGNTLYPFWSKNPKTSLAITLLDPSRDLRPSQRHSLPESVPAA